MAEAARKDDIASGHGCFPDTAITEGSPNVFINGQPAARVGDAVAPHGAPAVMAVACMPASSQKVHHRYLSTGSPRSPLVMVLTAAV